MCQVRFGNFEHVFTSSSLTTEMGMRNDNSRLLPSDLNFIKEAGIIHFLPTETICCSS